MSAGSWVVALATITAGGILTPMAVPLSTTAQPAGAASPSAAETTAREHARPRLVSEWSGLVPGTTAMLAVSFDIDPRWHLYWKGVSETGMPVRMQIKAPQGFEVGPIGWPAPRRYLPAEGILDHIHEEQLTLLIPISVPPTATPGQSVRFEADLEWLVCNESCIPGSGKVSLDLPVLEAGKSPVKSADAPRFDRARSALPIGVPRGATAAEPVKATLEKSTLRVQVPGATRLEFYPERECAPVKNLIDKGIASGDTLSLELAPEPGTKGVAAGVVGVFQSGKAPAYYSIFVAENARIAETGTAVPTAR